MKRLLALFLAFLLALPGGLITAMADVELVSDAVQTENRERTKIELPDEPIPTGTNKVYVAHDKNETGEYKATVDGGATPQVPYRTASGWLPLFTDGLVKDGGTIVIVGKGYFGGDISIPATSQPILFTAVDGDTDYTSRDENGNIRYMSESGGNVGQYGMFMIADVRTLTFEGDVIFDNVVILCRISSSAIENERTPAVINVNKSLVVTNTAQFAEMTGGVNYTLNINDGAYAYIHALGFEKYTGTGIIVVGDEIKDLVTEADFEGFEGLVVDEQGYVLFDFAASDAETTTPDDPTSPEMPDDPISKVNTVYLSDSGSDNNDGLSADNAVNTLTKAYQVLGDQGGQVVVVDTYTPASHFIAPDHKGKITIMGVTADSKYIIANGTRRFCAGGPTEFTDITIEQNYNMLFAACFNDLTFSSTCIIKENGYLSIVVAGGQGGSTAATDRDYIVKSSTLTINGGIWDEVVGSLRGSLYSPSGVHSTSEFSNYTLTINVGENAEIDKLFTFSRIFGGVAILAENSSCTVNLMGGKINRFLCQSDSKVTSQNGYGNGITVNIGPDFDLEGSFTYNEDKQSAEHIVTDDSGNMIFYGINGDRLWVNDTLESIGKTVVVLDAQIYDKYKDSTRFRDVTVIRANDASDGDTDEPEVSYVASGVDGNITWTLDTDGVLTLSGKGPMNDYSYWIQETPWNSYISDIKSVEIIEGVTSIGPYAFYKCTSLTSITIPDGVTQIGYFAFGDCSSLVSVSIPDSVTYIEAFAFSDCTGLVDVSFPDSIESFEGGIFDGCTNIKSTLYDNAYYVGNVDNPYILLLKAKDTDITSCSIHPSTKYIDDDAFYMCTRLIKASIPEGIEFIGVNAFTYCSSLVSITIPKTVEQIGENAFADCVSVEIINYDAVFANVYVHGGKGGPGYIFRGVFDGSGDQTNGAVLYIGKNTEQLISIDGCSIKYVAVDPSNEYYINDTDGVLYNKSMTSLLCFPSMNGITEFAVPETVVEIGQFAFNCNDTLESVTLPATVNTIGRCAFLDATKLKEIVIPQAVTKINGSTFRGCDALSHIVFGDNIETIGDYAFSECISLTEIDLPAGLKDIWYGAFEGCSSLAYVTIPGSVESIDPEAFRNCGKLSYAEFLGDAPESIDPSAFDQTSSDFTIYYHSGVSGFTSPEWIGYPCFAVEDVLDNNNTTPNGLKYALDDVNLTAMVVDAVIGDDNVCIIVSSNVVKDGKVYSVIAIGESAFSDCTSLESITIPAGIVKVDNKAFYGCTSLNEVNISSLFAWCRIDFAHYTSNPTYYAKNISANGKILTSVVVQGKLAEIKNYTFINCTSLKSVTIPEGIVSVGEYAFYGCKSLSDISIGTSVESIGGYAFRNCTALGEVIIPNSVNSIGTGCFDKCPNVSLRTCHGSAAYDYAQKNSIVFVLNEDVDGDGDMTNSDVTMLVRYLLGFDVGHNMSYADINSDGKLNNRDLIAIIRKLAWNE